MKSKHEVLIGCLACAAGLLLVACGAAAGEGFAIYLPAAPVTAEAMLTADLGRLALEEEPLLAQEDIVAYTWATHEIELTPSAAERVARLQVPTQGRPFVVTVDRVPIYGGAFWVGYSSQSYSGIVIETLLAGQQPLRIQLGYPESLELFTGEDRRSDPRIRQSLEKAGKLR